MNECVLSVHLFGPKYNIMSGLFLDMVLFFLNLEIKIS